MHHLRFGFLPAGNFQTTIRGGGLELVAGMARVGAQRGSGRIHLAAVYIYFLARRNPAHFVQPAVPSDVWRRSGAQLGRAEILYVLFYLRSWRRHYRDRCQIDPRPVRPRNVNVSNDWRFRRDLWRVTGCGGDHAAPAGVGVSLAGDGVHARVCDRDGRDRIFQHDWRDGRRRQPRVPPGRDAGGLHLFAARVVWVQRAELFFGLEEAAAEEEI